LDWIKEIENGKKIYIEKIILYNSRFIPEWFIIIEIDNKILSREEKELIMKRILFRYKDIIIFKDSYIRFLDPIIESSIII
jgi:hypothetical protein